MTSAVTGPTVKVEGGDLEKDEAEYYDSGEMFALATSLLGSALASVCQPSGVIVAGTPVSPPVDHLRAALLSYPRGDFDTTIVVISTPRLW